ncbi:MAG: glycosyltransferase family 2 protein [Chitinophagales bacterium]|nr:glycosyltransferase family 2 protein [Chitinophagales bacterium]
MSIFRVPQWVTQHLHEFPTYNAIPDSLFQQLHKDLARYQASETPLVSIVIPAYNEEKDMLKTLSSLAHNKSLYPTELIVVNNNSKDHTQEILDRCGVCSVLETKQGISYARQAGLEAARGKYILSADSDSIYPPEWGIAYIQTLEQNPDVAVVYGQYSFIPSEGATRLGLQLHELVAENFFRTRTGKLEAVNVMGFNFAYRREQALQIGGFKHDLDRAKTGRAEDGWMAYELADLGRIQLVKMSNRVWTSDRRLMEAGSLIKAFMLRVKKYVAGGTPHQGVVS